MISRLLSADLVISVVLVATLNMGRELGRTRGRPCVFSLVNATWKK